MSSLGSRSDPKPTPNQLAVALATMERKRYLHILAAEYISHACKLDSYCPNLLEALAFNTKIANWVLSSILQCDDLNRRADIKMFFVDVAQVNLNILGHLTFMMIDQELFCTCIGMSADPQFLIDVRHYGRSADKCHQLPPFNP